MLVHNCVVFERCRERNGNCSSMCCHFWGRCLEQSAVFGPGTLWETKNVHFEAFLLLRERVIEHQVGTRFGSRRTRLQVFRQEVSRETAILAKIYVMFERFLKRNGNVASFCCHVLGDVSSGTSFSDHAVRKVVYCCKTALASRRGRYPSRDQKMTMLKLFDVLGTEFRTASQK